jgi:hypothetical protein
MHMVAIANSAASHRCETADLTDIDCRRHIQVRLPAASISSVLDASQDRSAERCSGFSSRRSLAV